ncbi:hypothetical protein L2E82_49254 [Cichorium intybus]|uniref:Uncharacterized protein n=1 Tax=Cichorium intybus TaxID=13427 RepID=A0ACB8YZZ0_CICIN|nr:hypothetical protein L2E82_49254 [Cichorium intybus]
MAAVSPSLQANFYASSSKFCFVRLNTFNQRSFHYKKKSHSWIIKSVMNNKSINGDEAIEPARILLERLFVQTQKLEEKINKNSNPPQDIELEHYLGKLESDLQTALAVLRKKEEDLEAAENKILLEYRDLNTAKSELNKREGIISDAFLRQEKLENELNLANLDLASRATEIEDLKLLIEKRDHEMMLARSALELKEEEIKIMSDELTKKTEESANFESEVLTKSRILIETNEILKNQAVEIEELKETIREKNEELEISTMLLESENEKLKVVEANLEKQTMDWLVANEEMTKLPSTVEYLDDLTRVRTLLSDVRSELVSSRESLILSRKKMEDQQAVLENEILELEEHRKSLSDYTRSIEDAETEVERERVMFRLAEGRNQELQRDISIEKELINELQIRLNHEKDSLQKANEEISVIKDELNRKNLEFLEIQNRLESKEAELVDAKIEIQSLKSERVSLEIMLNEKESELYNAREILNEVNREIVNLKTLLGRENGTGIDYSEAKNVVERIFELTNKVVDSIEKPESKWEKKRFETELDVIRGTLRLREFEVLRSRREIMIKEDKVKSVLEKLDERENEMAEMKRELSQDIDDLRRLYTVAQERIGERTMGELVIERMELEAAGIEIEAAVSALEKITEMSRELLRVTSVIVDADSDLDVSAAGIEGCDSEDWGFEELRREAARLSEFTEKLVREAGIEDAVVDK